jgi:hypothetical protein
LSECRDSVSVLENYHAIFAAMTRIAHCSCGSLRAEATGEPALLGEAIKQTPVSMSWLQRARGIGIALARGQARLGAIGEH